MGSGRKRGRRRRWGTPGRVRVMEGGDRVGPRVTHRRRRSPRLPVGQGSGFCGLFPPPSSLFPLWAPPPAAPRAMAQAHLAPVSPQRPYPLEFHAPPTAQAQNCLPRASPSGA